MGLLISSEHPLGFVPSLLFPFVYYHCSARAHYVPLDTILSSHSSSPLLPSSSSSISSLTPNYLVRASFHLLLLQLGSAGIPPTHARRDFYIFIYFIHYTLLFINLFTDFLFFSNFVLFSFVFHFSFSILFSTFFFLICQDLIKL